MLFADLSLAQRLERAGVLGGLECVAAHSRLYPGGGAASERIAGGVAVFTGVDSPLTHALGLCLDGPLLDADLDRMEHFFRSRGAAAQVEHCPLSDPSSLRMFGERGYQVAEYSNVLVRLLNRAEQAPPLTSGVRVQRAKPSEADLWARTVAEGFFEDQVTPSGLEFANTLFHMPSATAFLAWIDREAAGGGAVAWHEGTAILFGTSSRPAYRKRGVQAALIHARLALAVVSGCDLAMVVTPPGRTSQRNVERQGFRVVYTRTRLSRELQQDPAR